MIRSEVARNEALDQEALPTNVAANPASGTIWWRTVWTARLCKCLLVLLVLLWSKRGWQRECSQRARAFSRIFSRSNSTFSVLTVLSFIDNTYHSWQFLQRYRLLAAAFVASIQCASAHKQDWVQFLGKLRNCGMNCGISNWNWNALQFCRNEWQFFSIPPSGDGEEV